LIGQLEHLVLSHCTTFFGKQITSQYNVEGVVNSRLVMAMVVLFWLTVPSSRHQNVHFDQVIATRP